MRIQDKEQADAISWHCQGWCARYTRLGLLALIALFMALFNTTQAVQAHDDVTPAAIGSPTALDGLLHDEELCGGGYRIAGTDLCTHGSDEAPPRGDNGEPDQPYAPTRIACIGNGVDGKRVQVMYVRTSLKPNRYAEYVDAIRSWAAGVDEIFSRSAHATGGHRHVRFVTNPDCEIEVLNIVLLPLTDITFTSMITALKDRGFDSLDRKYLLFVDADIYCGIGTAINDPSPGEENRNNDRAGYARVDTPCWGSSIAAHELTHTLGGVQHSAPNASGGWHCTDEYDLMCYSDAPYHPVLTYSCPVAHDILLDCNNDDYFHTDPPPDSYLATHWNVANSLFLSTERLTNNLPGIELATLGRISTFVAPARIQLVADAWDDDGSVVKVEFYEGTTLLDTKTAPPFSFTWENVAAGIYTLTAIAYDDINASTAAMPLTVEVIALPNIPPTVTLTVSTTEEWIAPALIPLTATAGDADGEITIVEFYSGSTLLHSDSDFPHTMTWSLPTPGTYTVTARAYDEQGASTISEPLTLTVKEPVYAPPVVQLSIANPTMVFSTPATITLSAVITTSNHNNQVERVDFYNEETLLGSDFDPPYTLQWQVETSGTYTVTAQAYDSQGLSRVSQPIIIVVAPSQPTPVDPRQDDEELPHAVYIPMIVRPYNEE